MDFKNMSLKSILLVSLASILLIGFVILKTSSKADVPAWEDNETQNTVQNEPIKGTIAIQNLVSVPQVASGLAPGTSNEDDAAIQAQLDRDRLEQKQTKDLKIKLEQTNLELEQEKALAEINKLKKENVGAFSEPVVDGQSNFPEIKVEYIGGNSDKKEAILIIGGASYQVKEKSSPTDNIQVVSISDSSVTLHFSAPQELVKIIDYKPE